ncbi:MAG: hypothetical protein LBG06_02195 [Deltaproteobacteria bacterium]|nr:hypothetical protein [Deltaproteobacteria bacterium]
MEHFRKLPLHMFGRFGGRPPLSASPEFRRMFSQRLYASSARTRHETLRALWRRLLRMSVPGRPSDGYWASVLAEGITDAAPEDLQAARRAVTAYRIFVPDRPEASRAVLERLRAWDLGRCGGEGLSWSDRGFYSRFKAVAAKLAGCLASPTVPGGEEPSRLADELAAMLEDGPRLFRLIADEPGRGYEILDAALRPLAGERCAAGSAVAGWSPDSADGYRRRIGPHLYSDPRPPQSGFWQGFDPADCELFGRVLAWRDLEFFLGIAREAQDCGGRRDRIGSGGPTSREAPSATPG